MAPAGAAARFGKKSIEPVVEAQAADFDELKDQDRRHRLVYREGEKLRVRGVRDVPRAIRSAETGLVDDCIATRDEHGAVEFALGMGFTENRVELLG